MKIYCNARQSGKSNLARYAGTSLWINVYSRQYKEPVFFNIEEISGDEYKGNVIISNFITGPKNAFTYSLYIESISRFGIDELFTFSVNYSSSDFFIIRPIEVLTEEEIKEIVLAKYENEI